jgi:polyisoprenoid-binding protein YceI
MIKKILTVLSFVVLSDQAQAQNLSATSNTISFFSKTPVEDIEAKTSKAKSILNPETKGIAFKVGIATFTFPNKLMQEHFNEKYMDTETIPNASFEGVIQEAVDLKKEGIYEVTVKGKLNLHGVIKDYTVKATIANKAGKLVSYCKFKVALKDHNIQVPKLVVKSIAENIDITVNAIYDVK